VYLYVLAEASAEVDEGQRLQPEQIELVYWFANHPRQPERFTYDAGMHAAAGQRLGLLVAEIAAMGETAWPLASSTGPCRRCSYQTLCEREAGILLGETEEDELGDEPLDLDLEQIPEIEF
jgi:hypothetical protein